MSEFASVEIKYTDNGDVYTNIITYKGGQIQVLSRPDYAPTAEFQRSDEIVRGLIRITK